ncbi:MAG: hypothetical protein ACLFRJ_10015 [Ectothiorhodospira sp.]
MVIAHQQSQSEKLDRLTDAMTRLATHEERLSNHYQGMQRLGGRMDRMETHLESVENRISRCTACPGPDSEDKPTWLERIVIGAVSSAGGMALGAWLMQGMGGA